MNQNQKTETCNHYVNKESPDDCVLCGLPMKEWGWDNDFDVDMSEVLSQWAGWV